MRKQVFTLVLIAAFIMGCASARGNEMDKSNNNSPGLSGIERNEMNRANNNAPGLEGNEWKLIDVYIGGSNTGFSRNTLPEDLKNFFTLSFDAETGMIGGVGAPNRYSAPYTKGDSQISIMLIRSTLMASFFQPENLNEHDFFVYLQNVYEWKLVNENLELYSKTESGSEVRLVFSL